MQICPNVILNLLTKTYFLSSQPWPSSICGKIVKNLSIHTDNSLSWLLAKCGFLEFSLPACTGLPTIYMFYREIYFPIFLSPVLLSLISLFRRSLWSLISVCLIKKYISYLPNRLSCCSSAHLHKDCSNRCHRLCLLVLLASRIIIQGSFSRPQWFPGLVLMNSFFLKMQIKAAWIPVLIASKWGNLASSQNHK